MKIFRRLLKTNETHIVFYSISENGGFYRIAKLRPPVYSVTVALLWDKMKKRDIPFLLYRRKEIKSHNRNVPRW